MTPRERAEQIRWVGKTHGELWDEVEQAINAAVEEATKRLEAENAELRLQLTQATRRAGSWYQNK